MASEVAVQVGPFVLEERIGAGGMGEVWRARHTRGDLCVAVKILTRGADGSAYRDAFLTEVGHAARLEHPNVVRVFDTGAVTRAQAGPELVEGRPWLAMELAAGSLRAESGRLSWDAVRAVLLSLLDALAHAHARGLVHRDVKPENLLRFADGSVKLADFGIARAWDQVSGPLQGWRVGTPAYMAPEQSWGSWRDHGPWTDLYAVGRTALSLLGDVPVPAGLQEWVDRLTAASHLHRVRRAADARALLLEINGAAVRVAPVGTSSAAVTTRSLDSETWLDLDLVRSALPEPEGEPVPPPAMTPVDWRVGEAAVGAVPEGMGLGLLGLREVPLVGREHLRDHLWDHLMRAIHGGAPGLVVLEGPAGVGKTRLARWVAERAHELGMGETFWLAHGPDGGPSDGVAGALQRQLRLYGLDRGEAELVLEARLRRVGVSDPWEWRSLSALAVPDEGDVVLTRDERLALLVRFVERERDGRAAVLVLDDVQWGHGSLELVRALTAREVPALVVCTVRSADPVLERTLAELLAEAAHGERLEVGPLGLDAQQHLAEGVLGLAPPLARELTLQSQGSPILVVQQVEDWAQRGLLVGGVGGWELAAGSSVVPAGGLDSVWCSRVAAALDGLPGAAAEALYLGAVLGRSVQRDEWEAACAAWGAVIPGDLEARLERQHLIVRDLVATAWSFSHRLLREILLHRAEEAGLLAPMHRGVADVLRAPGAAARRGRHLAAGERPREALEVLHDGARELIRQGRFTEAEQVLAERERVAESLALDPASPERLDGWLTRTRLLHQASRLDDALRVLERVDAAVRAGSARDLDACLLRASITRDLGQRDVSRAQCVRARALAQELGDELSEARANLVHCELEMSRGGWQEVLEVAPRVADVLEAHGLYIEAGRAHRVVSLTYQQRLDLEGAETHFCRASELFERQGSRYWSAEIHMSQGELARFRGDLDGAARHYDLALHIQRSVGSSSYVFTQANLGLVHMARGAFDTARTFLEPGLAWSIRQDRRSWEGVFRRTLAAVAAGLGEWDLAAAELEEASQIFVDTGFAEHDGARALEQLGELALADGRRELAGRAWREAVEHFEVLGNSELVASLRGRLSDL